MLTSWLQFVIQSLAKDDLIFSTTEWIGIDGHGLEVHIRIFAMSLAGTASIEIPDG